MSSRDDYPDLADFCSFPMRSRIIRDAERALDEIDALRRCWSEALIVLGYWDDVFALVPEWRVLIGDSKSEKTAEYIRWLETQTHAGRSSMWSPDPARAVTVRRTLTDRIPHFNTSNDDPPSPAPDVPAAG